MSRNVLLLLDGSRQNLTGQIPSTIGKLELKIQNTNSQLKRYTPGIATFNKNNFSGYYFGSNLDELTVYPNLEYLNQIGLNSDDKLSIVSFSRGGESAKRIIQYLNQNNTKVNQFIALEAIDATNHRLFTNALGLDLNRPFNLENVNSLIHYKALNDTNPIFQPTKFVGDNVLDIWVPSKHIQLGGGNLNIPYNREVSTIIKFEIEQLLISQGFEIYGGNNHKHYVPNTTNNEVKSPIKMYKTPNPQDKFHSILRHGNDYSHYRNLNPNIDIDSMPSENFVYFNLKTGQYEIYKE